MLAEDEPLVVPLPAVLVNLFSEVTPKASKVFSAEDLRTEWEKACVASGLGTSRRGNKARMNRSSCPVQVPRDASPRDRQCRERCKSHPAVQSAERKSLRKMYGARSSTGRATDS